jgi:hypothetical protein
MVEMGEEYLKKWKESQEKDNSQSENGNHSCNK